MEISPDIKAGSGVSRRAINRSYDDAPQADVSVNSYFDRCYRSLRCHGVQLKWHTAKCAIDP
jgi:hypothetical protein